MQKLSDKTLYLAVLVNPPFFLFIQPVKWEHAPTNKDLPSVLHVLLENTKMKKAKTLANVSSFFLVADTKVV